MNIAFLSDAIYPYNTGGKEKKIFEMTTRLAKKGHDVHIYCMKWWKTKEMDRLENGVWLHAISPYYPLYSGQRRSIKQGILFSLHALKLMFRKFDVLDVDHMPFFPLFTAKLVCIVRRKKLVATWHEVWGAAYWKKYMGGLGIFGSWIENISFLLPDVFLPASQHTYNKLKNEVKIKKPMYLVSNGIDFSLIQAIQPKSHKYDIIFAGRILAHKNVDVLIRAIKHLKDVDKNVQCAIIGNGPQKHQLENMVKDLELTKQISFYPFFEKSYDLYSFIKGSKLFVFPSSREGFGIVALEANCCGIPVITVNQKGNGTKDLIKNLMNGIVCELSAVELAEAIEKGLYYSWHPGKIKEFSKHFSWDKIAGDLERAYLML